MNIEDALMNGYKAKYAATTYKGRSLLEWARKWFTLDNDTFYRVYGFNFNPHKYPYLYDIVRKEVYKVEKEPGIHIDLFATRRR